MKIVILVIALIFGLELRAESHIEFKILKDHPGVVSIENSEPISPNIKYINLTYMNQEYVPNPLPHGFVSDTRLNRNKIQVKEGKVAEQIYIGNQQVFF